MGKGRHKPRTFEGEGGHVVAGDHHEPPSEPDHFPDGTDDLAVIDPDSDDVVGVVGDRPGKRPLMQAETLDEPDPGAARTVAVGDDRLEDITVGVWDGGGVHHVAQVAGDDLSGHDADHPGLPPAGDPDIPGFRHTDPQRSRRAGRGAVAGINHRDATLERPDDAEPVGVVDDAEVGKPPGSDGAPVMEPEPPGSGERGHAERLLDLEAARDRLSDAVIDVPLASEHISVPVVGGKAAPRRCAGIHEREKVAEVLLGRAFPDHDVYPPEELLSRLRKRRALVVALDPGVDVGVQISAGEERRMTIDDLKEVHLLCEVRIPGEDAGDVHHLGKPDDSLPPPEPGEVVGREHGAAGIKGCCRDTGREHDQDIERCPRSLGEEVLDPGRPADVGDLVGVGDNGRRAVRKDEPGILSRGKKRTLDMDMGVDQPGHHVGAVEVVLLLPMVVPEADDVAVLHREIHALPGTCEGVEDHAAGEDSIRRLKPPCRRKSHPVQGATSRSRMTDALRSSPTNTVRKTLYEPGCRSTGTVYLFCPWSRLIYRALQKTSCCSSAPTFMIVTWSTAFSTGLSVFSTETSRASPL